MIEAYVDCTVISTAIHSCIHIIMNSLTKWGLADYSGVVVCYVLTRARVANERD